MKLHFYFKRGIEFKRLKEVEVHNNALKPSVGEFVEINGESYTVSYVTWSIADNYNDSVVNIKLK